MTKTDIIAELQAEYMDQDSKAWKIAAIAANMIEHATNDTQAQSMMKTARAMIEIERNRPTATGGGRRR